MSAQADILQQGVIGKVVQDRQTLMELLGLIQQRAQYDDVKAKTARENGSEGDTSYAVMSSTSSFKAEQLANTKAFAAIDTLGAIDAPLGKLLDKINEEATAHPILTTAIYASATALTALTAAAGVGGLVGLSKAGAGGMLGKVAAAGAGIFSSSALMLGGAGAAGYGVGTGLSKGLQAYAPGAHDWIGQQVASYMAAFGNREAERALNINLSVDGKQLATVVNNSNSKEARRQ
jgi:hypothetical protein